MAQGIGVGFADNMRKVERDIQRSIPTDFDVDGEFNKMPWHPRSGAGQRNQTKTRPIQIIQNIYTPQYDYVKQQREAAKQFKLIARQV